MIQKVKIEKNSVQETLILPLYGKSWAVNNYPDIFKDDDCRIIMSSIDYDFSPLDSKAGDIKAKMGFLAAATRQYALVTEIKDYLIGHPEALVVNMGCGLDTAGHQADNGTCIFVNLDFPNVIELREKLIPSSERERNIPVDLCDLSWFDKMDFNIDKGAVFFASGVFIYFKKNQVRTLFCSMSERFPGARLAFDAQNRKGMELDLKAIKASGIDISTNFFLDKPLEELKSWSDNFSEVQWKKMSTGYIKPDKRFGLLYRILAQYADKTGMSQLNVIDFARK